MSMASSIPAMPDSMTEIALFVSSNSASPTSDRRSTSSLDASLRDTRNSSKISSVDSTTAPAAMPIAIFTMAVELVWAISTTMV